MAFIDFVGCFIFMDTFLGDIHPHASITDFNSQERRVKKVAAHFVDPVCIKIVLDRVAVMAAERIRNQASSGS